MVLLKLSAIEMEQYAARSAHLAARLNLLNICFDAGFIKAWTMASTVKSPCGPTQFTLYLIVLPDQAVAVGTVTLRAANNEIATSFLLGYWVAPDYRRKGMATLAVAELLKYLKLVTRQVELYAHVGHNNVASGKLLACNQFALVSEDTALKLDTWKIVL
ncbi:GNAT family N-acetyltransferase [Neolewinella antarctica]|uniref:RimJ/RimL family protein N-acetyltransferase n=1 Tax=Neolewinella antarctica TaxID=442734 RepID=A0ABX0X6B1_9BACT|nr:GNAT family N-acetyltransferase [Neolewinella antarctica]NJC24759.1 RimJ/RimL family protein N-acetyltransferase [Neolewinella antarctica]